MRRRDNHLRDHVKATVTMYQALDLLGMEPPDRSHKIASLDNPGERTPSLHIYDDHWFDYSTGQGGDVISFVMAARNIGFRDALQLLSGRTLPGQVSRNPSPPPKPPPLPDLTLCFIKELAVADPHPAEELVATRWPYLTLEFLLDHGIKAAERGLWAPHRDATGKVRGIKIRNYRNGAKHAVAGSRFTTRLYRVRTAPSAPVAVIVEGESDTWCVQKWLDDNHLSADAAVFGLPAGAGTWHRAWEPDLGDRHVVIAFDGDDAGQTAAGKLTDILGPRAVSIIPPDGRVAESILSASAWLQPWIAGAGDHQEVDWTHGQPGSAEGHPVRERGPSRTPNRLA